MFHRGSVRSAFHNAANRPSARRRRVGLLAAPPGFPYNFRRLQGCLMSSNSLTPEQQVQPQRQAYVPPQLTPLGDLRQLTLGGSLGRGDSGSPTVQRR